jgi:predicted HTH transcriptional regulator
MAYATAATAASTPGTKPLPIDGVPFDQIAESHLRALLEAPVPEGRTLEYKRDVYGPRDSDRAEFAKDVSAMANTIGGHLVIGMDGTGGVPAALGGIGAEIDPDEQVRRLESIARDGLKARLPGLQVRAVPLAGGRHAIVVRVPSSLNPPHRVVLGGRNRFYARSTAGTTSPTSTS